MKSYRRLAQIVLVGILAVGAGQAGSSHAAVSSDSCNPLVVPGAVGDRLMIDLSWELQTLNYINKQRTSHGLDPLQTDATAWTDANWWAAKNLESQQYTFNVPCAPMGSTTYGDLGGTALGVYDSGATSGGGNVFLSPDYHGIGLGHAFNLYDTSEQVVTLTDAATPVPSSDVPATRPGSASLAYKGRDVDLEVLIRPFDSDPSGFTQVVSARAVHGRIIVGWNGASYYEPPENFLGTDAISYTVSNLYGRTTTGTFLIKVTSNCKESPSCRHAQPPGGSGAGGGGKHKQHPALTISLGVKNVAYRSQWKEMDAYIYGQTHGKIRVSVRNRHRILGRRSVQLGVAENGAIVSLRSIMHGKTLRPGHYLLVVRFQRHKFDRKFRVV